MKTILIFCLFLSVSCIPRAYPPGPNPLDTPGSSQPTAGELHTKNLRLITGNPAHH